MSFDDCHEKRVEAHIGELPVAFIDLQNLRRNKLASGRYKDLADIDNLPEEE